MIFAVTESEQEMKTLLEVVEQWCLDFKMKISIKKTQIIGADEESIWVLKDMKEEYNLKMVKSWVPGNMAL